MHKNTKPPIFRSRVLSCFTWTRTKDNAINSRGLYQLSYEASTGPNIDVFYSFVKGIARNFRFYPFLFIYAKNTKPPIFRSRVLSCFTWTRTKDNAINSRGLYQLSYEASTGTNIDVFYSFVKVLRLKNFFFCDCRWSFIRVPGYASRLFLRHTLATRSESPDRTEAPSTPGGSRHSQEPQARYFRRQ